MSEVPGLVDDKAKMQPEEVEIIDCEPQYQPDSFEQNKLWIEKYFLLEEADIRVLSNPDEHILSHGGSILLAELHGKIVGTCKKTSDKVYELTKMALDENYRGRKIGEKFGYATIEKARELKRRRSS